MKSEIRVLKIKNNEKERVDDVVASEVSITIKANGNRVASILATPSDISELACGFFLSLGKISSLSDISEINRQDGEVDIIGKVKESLELILTSGCGKGLISHSERKKVNGNFSLSSFSILKFIKEFQSMSSGFKDTGTLHSAAICDRNKIIGFKEDIGRHNAVDKIIGSLFLKKEGFSDKALLTSGRITSEIVIKAMNVGIPMVISRAGPTDLAIHLAEEAGITLVGFARGERMNVYTNSSRIKNNSNYRNTSIQEKIKELCKKKNAIILAHNYQLGEVQDIADSLGDSLDLSIKAKETNADIVVFCGVHFMAETAKILSPEKMVLMPDINAGCPLADMISVPELKSLKEEHPDAIVVSYVNTSSEIKAESDYCCTSRNGIDVINSIPKDKRIIFTPDKWLGDYISRKTGRDLILWNGFCPTHLKIIKNGILKLKEKHPGAELIIHPECTRDVVLVSDFVYGTGGMIKRVKESNAKEFIIGTENGIIHRLKKENPAKVFYPASELAICPNMKLTTLEKVLWSLEDEKYKIEIEKEIMDKARTSIERMLEIVNV